MAGAEKWIVVRGGASGAYLALRGALAGHDVTVLESGPKLGGLTLTDTFEVDGQSVSVDSFYHVILESDRKLGTQANAVAASFMVSTFRSLVQAKLSGAGDRFGVLLDGYEPVFDAMAAWITESGGTLLTDARVASVTSGSDPEGHAAVTCTLANGETLIADRVLVTAPGPVTSAMLPHLSGYSLALAKAYVRASMLAFRLTGTEPSSCSTHSICSTRAMRRD